MAWFHCGRCASLFKAVGGDDADRRCAVCGEDPSIGMEAKPSAGTHRGEGRDPMLRVKMAEVETPKIIKREIKRYKSRYFALKLVAVWTLLLGVLAVCAHLFWKERPRDIREDTALTSTRGTLGDGDIALINKAYPKIARNLGGFLSSGTPEERNQFVRTPVDTARRMARFYQTNPFVNFDVPSIKGTGSGVIRLPDGRHLIENRWSISDGRSFDTVFFDEDGDWRLDWEEFVRFGDQPWLLFLSGTGNAEGEFRLFARERMPDQRSSVGALRISLHASRFGHPNQTGDPSPEILVDQNSETGRMLKAAFQARNEERPIFGSNLPNQDPEGMIRVRVKVKRSDGSLGKAFSITEVKACHWLSIDDPGVPR